MIAQYLALKDEAVANGDDCLLFFRMGDFYELFFEDAAAAAAALDIALTKRGEHAGQPIPMCGVPVHAHELYLARLIRAGFRVAIAEQVEDPAEAKKRGGKSIVARAIVRVVTPGTLTEAGLLEPKRANWLAALLPAGDSPGALAWCDCSTGAFHTMAGDAAALAATLARLAPAELIVPEGSDAPGQPRPAGDFAAARGKARLQSLFGVATLDGFGQFTPAEIGAAGALIAYVEATARGSLPLITPPRPEPPGHHMAIDAATRASLELAGGRTSLIGTIDCTVTAAGGRQLAEDISAPLIDPAAIADRLDLVQWFHADGRTRQRTREALAGLPDLARVLGRLAVGRWTPRDLGQMRDGLALALQLKRALAEAANLAGPPALLASLLGQIGPAGSQLGGLVEALTRALVAEPPTELPGAIQPGHDAALDALRETARDGRSAVMALESRLKAETGITQLKIRHNGVLGYHIEVPAGRADPLLDRKSVV